MIFLTLSVKVETLRTYQYLKYLNIYMYVVSFDTKNSNPAQFKRRKSMKKTRILMFVAFAIVLLALAVTACGGSATAGTTTPEKVYIVVTATPNREYIVVTATPESMSQATRPPTQEWEGPTPQSGNAHNFDSGTMTLKQWVSQNPAFVRMQDIAGNTPISSFLAEGDFVTVHMFHNQRGWEPRVHDITCWGSVINSYNSSISDLVLPSDSTVVWWDTSKMGDFKMAVNSWNEKREVAEGWTCDRLK